MARAIFCSSFRWPSEFREWELQVSDLPPSTRRAPKTHTLSLPRPYSRGALIRSPSGDHPGAGGKAHRLPVRLVRADHGRVASRVGVEPDHSRPYGTNSGSVLCAHGRVFYQRTPSRIRMRLRLFEERSIREHSALHCYHRHRSLVPNSFTFATYRGICRSTFLGLGSYH